MADTADGPTMAEMDGKRKADLAFHFRRRIAGKPPCMANRRSRARERWWRWLFVALYNAVWCISYVLFLSGFVTAMKWRWLRGEIRDRRIAAEEASYLMRKMATPLARQAYSAAMAQGLVNVRPMTEDDLKGLQ